MPWVVYVTGLFYKTPINLNQWWNFGVVSFFFLLVQIITGLFLAMFYDPNILYAFASVMAINNDVYFGWWLRSLHSNGASFFFLVVYVHVFRSFFYGSFTFPRHFFEFLDYLFEF